MKAVLVYQAGIANVFEVESFGGLEGISTIGSRGLTERLLQSDFNSCVMFARGMKASGVRVEIAGCNQPGDITRSNWTFDLESLPFSERFVSKI